MSDILQYVEDEQTSEFYPTPPSLVQKMLEGIKFEYVETVLEPSAGKGDILRELAKKETEYERRGLKFDVDCIEIDPNLRQILKFNFGERKEVLKGEYRSIKDRYKYCEKRYNKGWIWFNQDTNEYEPLPQNEVNRLEEIDTELTSFFTNGIKIVHEDFLTYNPFKQYDLIIMNPPFSNGDRHLLKALKLQEGGGSIVCLLNAETLRNPYTETRRELLRQLNKYNAQIEYIENAFVSAERRTGVEVALIKVSIKHEQEESDIYNRFEEAEKYEIPEENHTELEVTDVIKAIVNQYKVECKAGIELIRQYLAMMPHMLRSFETKKVENPDGTVEYRYVDTSPILRLTDSSERGYDSVTVNEFLHRVRFKYWSALMSKPEFVGKLTSKLQDEYRKRVNKLADYEFSEYNIKMLHAEMNAQIKTGIENEIVAMFDRLTEEHSWYPECQKNKHYYDGWKTNIAHKLGNKVIIPSYGVFNSWDSNPRAYEARKTLEDIERILNFLDGHMTAEVDSWNALEYYFRCGNTKNIPMKYFKATFYKKGTVHLVFTCPELIERFNIYVAQNKNWLPPNYGKVKYKDMTTEEKTVVDSFQGEAAYNEVLEKAKYYLAPVTNNQLQMLGE